MKRRMAMVWGAGVLGCVLTGSLSRAQPGQPGSDAPDAPMVGRVAYKKLETRAATERAIIDALFPAKVEWGEWHALWAFPFKKFGDLHLDAGPEADILAAMSAGKSPDFSRTYPGKGGGPRAWRALGDMRNRIISFSGLEGRGIDWAAGYAYTTITSAEATTLNLSMGSDDGMRMWLNGRLVLDVDAPRSLNPDEDHVRLDLRAGVNHLFFKVSQGQGGFEMQVNARPELDAFTMAQLQYHLDVDFPQTDEAEYVRNTIVAVPGEIELEVGGLAIMPDGRPIVSTRRGDIWIVDGAYDSPAFQAKYTRFASGLHEPLGLSVRVEKGVTAVYCVQRGELTRMPDANNDGAADSYETFSDAWGVSGNYHEFAFGPKFDRDGNAWVTLNVGFCAALGKSIVPYRGWAIRVAPDGTSTAWCDGLRSPNGIGEFSDGAMFYLDNQGDYVGTNRMSQMVKGAFMGHPAGLRWREGWSEGQTPPPVQPATIWFPYRKMGQSVADFLLLSPETPAAAPFGVFAGQVFVGDQTDCLVMRCFLEKVRGKDGVELYQGACFPFRRALQCGVNRLVWGKDGSMFVGQTDRGWGSIGRARFGLERLDWTGKVPFEIREMRARPDGFELTFTGDVDPVSAASAASYTMTSYTYEYHQTYGSDEMETRTLAVRGAKVVDPRTVHL
ncbi:MAG: hypothetical protein JNL50_04825, partial [Phycisphaerae bacterium]|nr:hypothetical protein [Phycisphaerae bacterium]